jgi:hypothetical protein
MSHWVCEGQSRPIDTILWNCNQWDLNESRCFNNEWHCHPVNRSLFVKVEIQQHQLSWQLAFEAASSLPSLNFFHFSSMLAFVHFVYLFEFCACGSRDGTRGLTYAKLKAYVWWPSLAWKSSLPTMAESRFKIGLDPNQQALRFSEKLVLWAAFLDHDLVSTRGPVLVLRFQTRKCSITVPDNSVCYQVYNLEWPHLLAD